MALQRDDRPIYAVYSVHEDRNILLDFACGNKEDIEAYFDERKAYGLEFVLVDPIVIEPGFSSKKSHLLRKKKELENQLKALSRDIEQLRASNKGQQ